MLSYQNQYELVQSLASDDNSTNLVVVKDLLRQGQRVVESNLGLSYTEESRTFTVVTDAITGTSNQSYRLPENWNKFVSFYVTVGTTRYGGGSEILVQDESIWREINTSTSTTGDCLQLVFIRNDRIELYPIPATAYTATLRYQATTKPLYNDDYTTGTITTLTNGASAVTASGSTFTAGMVGRYFKINADNQWYKISAFGTATTLTLAGKYQGTSIAAGTSAYTIGEFPITPPDTHMLPVYYALWKLALFRKDVQMGREWERQWKEGIKEALDNHNNLAASQVISENPRLKYGVVNQNWFPTGMS